MSEQTTPQTQPENRQSAVGDSSSYVSPVPPLANENDSGIGGIITAFIAIIALLVSGYNYWQLRQQQPQNTPNVVILDFDQIGSRLLLQQGNNSNEMLAKTQQLQQGLSNLSNDGTIILQRQSVIAAPVELDITEQMATELGLTKPITQNNHSTTPSNPLPTPVPQAQKLETDGLDASLD